MSVLPALALRGKIIFPKTSSFFEVSRPKSIKALEEAMNTNQRIFLLAQKSAAVENPDKDDLYQVGTIVKIQQMVKVGQNVLRVFAEGEERAIAVEFIETQLLFRAEAEVLEDRDFPVGLVGVTAVRRSIQELMDQFVDKNPRFLTQKLERVMEQGDLQAYMNELMSELPASLEKKQQFLEETRVMGQAKMLMEILTEELAISDVRNDLARQVKENVDKNQRDYLLREQQKVIRKELGEEDIGSDADDYEEKCDALEASDEVKEKIRKEIRRFRQTPQMAAESAMMRAYIETMLEMPWDHATTDCRDMQKAKDILEADHYGLEKVKDRIIDYLAVHMLKKDGDTPILCLVGPPGTGKTSIAKSIARALDKKYIRISLGGVHDEAEIRGHRRTYIGALPGRIAEGIRQAGVKNPLMLLDEIDKVSSDYRGDTASALLEVLDGEQNRNFRDHYLEVPLDLSDVLFIATANEPNRIPRALMDRMEIIELGSYTENEKFHIAKRYLIPKQRECNGIAEDQITIPDEIVYTIIRDYTREAGVRGLERKIGQLMHKAARAVLAGQEKLDVTEDNLQELLGVAPYVEEKKRTKSQVGVARGLAWTAVGGTTLSIEVNVMPGQGKLVLTGQMGDVMKESAQIGLSYLRSIAKDYGIEKEFFEENDIHIHIPEGAVPKDGPSAGITMATAMLSAFTEKPVRGNLAMTGEITLRGNVLPIGGLKEKLLAAKTAGMKEVLVPDSNRRNVAELDAEITEGLKITYVDNMKQVLKKAFSKR
ncbi:MAG: endopeptidase La [Lachnospiraceae bacterium]|nr:endopeptidase La [Lachnospiraceae bacterium]